MTDSRKEYLKKYKKEYRLNNKQKIAKQKSDWQKANPKKLLEHNKTYYLKLNLSNKDISYRTLNAWSYQIRERDTSCLYCGSTDKLHAHHILSKSKHPEFALFLNNGITLCQLCHIQEHIINGDI